MSAHDMSAHDDRLDELLARDAVEGLTDAEALECDKLLREAKGAVDVGEYHVAVAAAQATLGLEIVEPMPADVRARVLGRSPAARPSNVSRPRPWTEMLGWYVAAASIIALLFTSWPEQGGTQPGGPQIAQTPIELHRRLVSEVTTLDRAPCRKGSAPGAHDVTGEVVWCTGRQEGYLVIEGLPVNDPGEAQYQIWIVAPSRDERPVDGGVFDIDAEGRVVIPIDARLRIEQPRAFVVTREKPGGVVVSKEPPLVEATIF